MTNPSFPNLGITMAEIEAGWPVVQERLRRLTEAFAISVEELQSLRIADGLGAFGERPS